MFLNNFLYDSSQLFGRSEVNRTRVRGLTVGLHIHNRQSYLVVKFNETSVSQAE